MDAYKRLPRQPTTSSLFLSSCWAVSRSLFSPRGADRLQRHTLQRLPLFWRRDSREQILHLPLPSAKTLITAWERAGERTGTAICSTSPMAELFLAQSSDKRSKSIRVSFKIALRVIGDLNKCWVCHSNFQWRNRTLPEIKGLCKEIVTFLWKIQSTYNT